MVEATIATPGVVLRRPVGSHGEFTEKAMLPKAPEGRRRVREDRVQPAHGAKKADTRSNEKLELKAAAALEKERKLEAVNRAKAKADRERAKKQRERIIAKANAAFEGARSRHEGAVDSIRQRRLELDKEEAQEKERWEREQQRHDDATKEAEA
ncbi:hypothetical protein NKH85_19635 [Mesorhizobium sp. M0924]|uniref:hypothetical protein n=1 Tax=unclassified Mesorhizobium TaxID=325217 RepID=UPI003338D832